VKKDYRKAKGWNTMHPFGTFQGARSSRKVTERIKSEKKRKQPILQVGATSLGVRGTCEGRSVTGQKREGVLDAATLLNDALKERWDYKGGCPT